MIKKFILPALAISVAISSCSKLEDVESPAQAMTYVTNSLIIPSDPAKAPTPTSGNYIVTVRPASSSISISTPGVLIEGQPLSFATTEFPFSSTSEGMTFSGGSASAGGFSITDINGLTPSYVYMLTTPLIPGFGLNQAQITHPLILSYKLGTDYTVKTFPSDAFYGGKTNTNYMTSSGEQKTFTNEEIIYRVVFDGNLKTATVIIYNAKFAAEQPVTISAMVLKGLEVKYSHNGYTIQNTPGVDVIPEIPEGDKLIQNPGFPFKNFSLQTVSDNLVNVTAAFNVGTRYTGMFNGSYTASPR